MKACSQPEALEDRFSPAALTGSFQDSTSNSTIDTGSESVDSSTLALEFVPPSPSALTPPSSFAGFEIRNATLNPSSTVIVNTDLIEVLGVLGTTGTSFDAFFATGARHPGAADYTLANVIAANDHAVSAAHSVVGADHSAELVVLSSAEFESAPAGAFRLYRS